jgi:hypothetical protein
MKRPDNINDALAHLHKLLAGIATDASYENDRVIESYPEYFNPIKDAALDAHLLVTWIKDNIKELHK